LDKRSCIVTGGASGIGEAIARLFAAEGARVLIGDLDEAGGERVASGIRSRGGDARFTPVDVSQADSVGRMVETAVDELGGVDVLVCAAGRQVHTPHLADVDEAEWDLVMDVNAKGVFLCTKAVLPAMVAKGSGVIVNVCSASVLEGDTFSVPYSASKAAVQMLTIITSSQYLRKGVRANCVLPGLIDTPGSQNVEGKQGTFDSFVETIPAGRAGTPGDVANLVLFLASDDSSFISGSSYVIDGGRDAR
jgi:NAD(P)-dependent dehydrogenase (short-subunit alcohol dehydrogenase family)